MNLIENSILFFNIDLFKDRVLFAGMKKRRGTICPRVQIDGVLFVRMCKTTGYYLSACAKMTGYCLCRVLFVRDSFYNYTNYKHFTDVFFHLNHL